MGFSNYQNVSVISPKKKFVPDLIHAYNYNNNSELNLIKTRKIQLSF